MNNNLKSEQVYKEKIKKLYAECIDYAANGVHLNIDRTITAICRVFGHKFDTLDKEFIDNYTGKSLIQEILNFYFWDFKYEDYEINTNSKEYILGLYLCEMGLYSKMPFRDIIIRVNSGTMMNYLKEHNFKPNQEDFNKFVRKIVRLDDYVTRLKIYREHAGLSQSELADKAGVNVRNIQMYEQRNNNINSASAEILKKIAAALKVRVDDLLETL